jgi:NitT/TauT family transport system substrate-binding protein
MPMMQTRRRFLTTLSLAGAASFVRMPSPLAAEGALETTTVRIAGEVGVCMAPLVVTEDLLRAEGFTDVRYPRIYDLGTVEAVAGGAVDFEPSFVFGSLPRAIEAGLPIVALAGLHIGCFELFAREGIRNVADLKGKSVGLQGAPWTLLTLMAASVGLDPTKDIRWVTQASTRDRTLTFDVVTDPSTTPLDLFAEGKIDAFLAGGSRAEEVRARRVGHVILNTTTDRPWSQYFCCMLVANRDYVRKYPVATKRVLRAILKGIDLCASEPARVAQRLVDGGITPRYDYAFETLRGIPYDKWREDDPEDSIRFYALRLHEAGLIKSSPNKLITDGTDWRFLNELKRELKT